MIAIVRRKNIKDDTFLYTVGINDRITAEFTHSRKNGMAACLRAAADAVEKAETEQLVKLFTEMESGWPTKR